MTIDEAIDYTEIVAKKFEQYSKDIGDIYDKIPSDDWAILFMTYAKRHRELASCLKRLARKGMK